MLASLDTPVDIRAAIVSFMRLERNPQDSDCFTIQYLERLCAHMTIFRAFIAHMDVMRRDRHMRLARQRDALELAVINRVPADVSRVIIEEVRTRMM